MSGFDGLWFLVALGNVADMSGLNVPQFFKVKLNSA